jgi:hypothetical protein
MNKGKEVRYEARAESEKRIPKILLRSDRSRIGNADLEDDEGHGDREDAIRERPIRSGRRPSVAWL